VHIIIIIIIILVLVYLNLSHAAHVFRNDKSKNTGTSNLLFTFFLHMHEICSLLQASYRFRAYEKNVKSKINKIIKPCSRLSTVRG